MLYNASSFSVFRLPAFSITKIQKRQVLSMKINVRLYVYIMCKVTKCYC